MHRSKKDLLRIAGAATDKVLVGPQMVSIHITNVCNLFCKYCPFHSDKKASLARRAAPTPVPWLDFKAFVDDCRDLGVDVIVLSGEGDPLTHPHIKQIIPYIRAQGMKVNINTNGAFFDTQLIDALNDVEVLNFHLSSITGDAYDRLQSDNNRLFAQVVKNCQRIIRNRKDSPTPFFRMACVLNKKNYRNIEAIVNLAEFLGFDYIKFAIVKVNSKTKSMAITGDHVKYFKQVLLKAERRGVFKKIGSNIKRIYQLFADATFFKEPEDVFFKGYSRSFYYERHFKTGFSCFKGWFYCFIDLKGAVYLCCNNRRVSIGNIRKKTFKEIWASKAAMRARLLLRDRFDIGKAYWRECHQCTDKDTQLKIAPEVALARMGRRP